MGSRVVTHSVNHLVYSSSHALLGECNGIDANRTSNCMTWVQKAIFLDASGTSVNQYSASSPFCGYESQFRKDYASKATYWPITSILEHFGLEYFIEIRPQQNATVANKLTKDLDSCFGMRQSG